MMVPVIDLNETVTIGVTDRHTGRECPMTVDLWVDFDELSSTHPGLPFEAAAKILDIRTRRIAEALNRDPDNISEFMRERFGR